MSDEPGQMSTIDPEGCLALLRSSTVGRLVFEKVDGPRIVPLNYVLESGTLFVRVDRRSEASQHVGRVVFEVDAIDEATQHGWSVIVRGVMGDADAAMAELLGDRLQPWAPGDRDACLAIEIISVTGRWVAAARGGYRPALEGYL